jgi:hypothetical protein
LHWVVMVGCGTYGFIWLYMWNGSFIVSFPFLLLYHIIQRRGSALGDRDKITRLHMTFQCLVISALYS